MILNTDKIYLWVHLLYPHVHARASQPSLAVLVVQRPLLRV